MQEIPIASRLPSSTSSTSSTIVHRSGVPSVPFWSLRYIRYSVPIDYYALAVPSARFSSPLHRSSLLASTPYTGIPPSVMCTAVARRIFLISVPIRAHPWAVYLPPPIVLLPVVWQYSLLFSCASVGCLVLAAIPASIPHLSPIAYSLKEASYSAASSNLSSLAFYVHCPNYSGILLVFRAKSFPSGEDLGEAFAPPLTPKQ